MINVGDLWTNEREARPYRVKRIVCAHHGDIPSARAVLELNPEDRGCAIMHTRCPRCGQSAQVYVEMVGAG